MDQKKYFAYVVVAIALSAVLFYQLSSATKTTLIKVSEPFATSSGGTALETTGSVTTASDRATASEAGIGITLKTEEGSFALRLKEGASVLDAMKAAEAEGFTFTGNEYPSLGIYIDSIGGKKASDGFYWILYINGKTSTTGASQTTLSSGDTVEWKYEKGY